MGVGPTIELDLDIEIERVDCAFKPWKIVDSGSNVSSLELGSVEYLLGLLSSEVIPLPLATDGTVVGEKFKLKMKMEIYEFKFEGIEELEVNWTDSEVVCIHID
jgi:hypothetical protein